MKNLFDLWLQGNEDKDFEVMIVGDAGSGKSILARHLRKKYPYACVHECRPKKLESLGIAAINHSEVDVCGYVFVIDRPDHGNYLRAIKVRSGKITVLGPFMLHSRDGEVAW